MARNTLEAVFGALGAGLTGYGRDVARRREEEQARLDRERQADRDRLALFEAGLEPSADVQGRRQRLTQATQATQAMAGAPMPGMSAVGPALAAATRAMGEDVDRGRRITIGGTEYVQPFSRTAQGIEQRELQRQAEEASIARQQQLADDEAEREFQRQRDAANAEQNRLARESAERIARIRGDIASQAAATRQQAAQQPAFGSSLDYTQDLRTIEQFVPTQRPSTRAGERAGVIPASRPLNRINLMFVRRAAEGDDRAMLAMAAAEQSGRSFANELAYYTTAAGIAQAYAIQEQRGRNVSDLDIRNRVRQITVQPEEVGNTEVELLKANRLRQWANLLQNRPQDIPQIPEGTTPGTATSRLPEIVPAARVPQTVQAESTTTGTARRYTPKDYQAALSALGLDASDDDVRKWLLENQRR